MILLRGFTSTSLPARKGSCSCRLSARFESPVLSVHGGLPLYRREGAYGGICISLLDDGHQHTKDEQGVRSVKEEAVALIHTALTSLQIPEGKC
jgi:hypothetical protein